MNDTQRSRKWQLTFANPAKYGYTHDFIKERLNEFKSIQFWCMSDEIGKNGEDPDGFEHTHLFIASSQAVRFSTLQNKFPGVHLDLCRGTAEQNRDYVYKIGKYANTEKETTNLKDTHEEWGEMPIERPGARNDLADLYDMIKQGMSDYDILDANPQYMMSVDKIGHARQVVLAKQMGNQWRDLEIHYLYGKTALGKTRYVMDKYGYENVYRVDGYSNPFDNYDGQDVILFDEFKGQINMELMLKYLDGYPVKLDARYYKRVACYTKVYFTSNLPLMEQYQQIRRNDPDTWNSFIRRISKVHIYLESNVYIYPTDIYVNGWIPAYDHPFDGEPDLKELYDLSVEYIERPE